MSEIFPEPPITSLPAAVAFLGALPMSVGPVPLALSEEREQEIRSLDLLALMSDRAAPVVSGHLAALLDEVTRLRAERAAIGDEVARFGICGAALPATKALVKRADELVTENAELRAQVAALLEERRSTNESVSEAAEALRVQRDRIAELETLSATARTEAIADVGNWLDEVGEKNAAYLVRTVDVPAARAMRPVLPQAITEDGCSCPPADHPHQVGCPLDVPAPGSPERPVNELTQTFAPVAALREVLDGEHYAYVHHEHRTPHDMPELGGS